MGDFLLLRGPQQLTLHVVCSVALRLESLNLYLAHQLFFFRVYRIVCFCCCGSSNSEKLEQERWRLLPFILLMRYELVS